MSEVAQIVRTDLLGHEEGTAEEATRETARWDDEILELQRMCRTLDRLEPTARRRVLNYLVARFGAG